MSQFKQQVPVHNIETKVMHAQEFDVLDLEGKGGKKYDSSLLHRHTFFELFFFTGGKGNHEIDFMHYPVEKNSAHFVSPGQIHKLTLNKTRGYVICFTEDFMSLPGNENFTEKFPFYDSASSPVLELNKAIGKDLGNLVSSVIKELRTNGYNADLLRAYLHILLLKIKAFFLTGQKNTVPIRNKHAKVTAFKHLINRYYLLHRPVSEYASELSVTPNHLNALCKMHEGKTATQLVQERLLLEAKRLLYATDITVKEVSFRLRFEDVAYFNRFFKKQTRLAPAQYRKTFQKDR